MRSTGSGWALAAVLVAGCGAGHHLDDLPAAARPSSHASAPAACGGCAVSADGSLAVGDAQERLSVLVVPGSGPGYAGQGLAATGHFEMGWPFAFAGEVDTLDSCGPTGTGRTARASGPITSPGGGRFTVDLTEGQGAPDTLSLVATYAAKPSDRLVETEVRGEVHVDERPPCENASQSPQGGGGAGCPEGHCRCPEDPDSCAPCGADAKAR